MHEPAAPPQTFVLGALAGLIFVVAVLGMTGWRPGPSWALIAPAIAINVAGDGVLVHLANEGQFHRGSPADTLFVTSALLLGLAAFYPTYAPRAPVPAPGGLPGPLRAPPPRSPYWSSLRLRRCRRTRRRRSPAAR